MWSTFLMCMGGLGRRFGGCVLSCRDAIFCVCTGAIFCVCTGAIFCVCTGASPGCRRGSCVSTISSEATRPSRKRMMRLAWRAMRCSWVTMTMVRPRALRSCSMAMISPPERESRLPVGSRPGSCTGSLIRARAMATRCVCPPESSCGWWGCGRRAPRR